MNIKDIEELLTTLIGWLETSPSMSHETYINTRNGIYDEARRLLGELKK